MHRGTRRHTQRHETTHAGVDIRMSTTTSSRTDDIIKICRRVHLALLIASATVLAVAVGTPPILYDRALEQLELAVEISDILDAVPASSPSNPEPSPSPHDVKIQRLLSYFNHDTEARLHVPAKLLIDWFPSYWTDAARENLSENPDWAIIYSLPEVTVVADGNRFGPSLRRIYLNALGKTFFDSRPKQYSIDSIREIWDGEYSYVDVTINRGLLSRTFFGAPYHNEDQQIYFLNSRTMSHPATHFSYDTDDLDGINKYVLPNTSTDLRIRLNNGWLADVDDDVPSYPTVSIYMLRYSNVSGRQNRKHDVKQLDPMDFFPTRLLDDGVSVRALQQPGRRTEDERYEEISNEDPKYQIDPSETWKRTTVSVDLRAGLKWAIGDSWIRGLSENESFDSAFADLVQAADGFHTLSLHDARDVLRRLRQQQNPSGNFWGVEVPNAATWGSSLIVAFFLYLLAYLSELRRAVWREASVPWLPLVPGRAVRWISVLSAVCLPVAITLLATFVFEWAYLTEVERIWAVTASSAAAMVGTAILVVWRNCMSDLAP